MSPLLDRGLFTLYGLGIVCYWKKITPKKIWKNLLSIPRRIRNRIERKQFTKKLEAMTPAERQQLSEEVQSIFSVKAK